MDKKDRILGIEVGELCYLFMVADKVYGQHQAPQMMNDLQALEEYCKTAEDGDKLREAFRGLFNLGQAVGAAHKEFVETVMEFDNEKKEEGDD